MMFYFLFSTGCVQLLDEEMEMIKNHLSVVSVPNSIKERVILAISKAHNIKDVSVEDEAQKFIEVNKTNSLFHQQL